MRAESLGHWKAPFSLGAFYQEGSGGVVKNTTKALELYKRFFRDKSK